VDETERTIRRETGPSKQWMTRMERLVEEASALMSEDSALMDLPKHCSPLRKCPTHSQVTVLVYGERGRAILVLEEETLGHHRKLVETVSVAILASEKLKLLAKKRSPL